MSPGFFVHDPTGGAYRYAKLRGKGFDCNSLISKSAHFENLSGGEFCGAVLIASEHEFRVLSGPVSVAVHPRFRVSVETGSSPCGTTSFQASIPNVGGVSSEPEMSTSLVSDPVDFIGSDVVISNTSAVSRVPRGVIRVAGVGDDCARVRPRPGCQPPSIDMSTDVTLLKGSKLPVSIFVGPACPHPAILADVDLGPKAVATTGTAILSGHRLSPSVGVLPPRHCANNVGASCVDYTSFLRVKAA